MSIIENSLNEIYERAEAEIQKLADAYRTEVLIPVCKQANMEYTSGNETFFFEEIIKHKKGKSFRYPETIYDVDDCKNQNKEFLIPIINDLNCSTLCSNVKCFGFYIADVEKKHFKD